MKKKRKKDKEAEEIIELEKELLNESDSIDQFGKEDKEAICRYIG